MTKRIIHRRSINQRRSNLQRRLTSMFEKLEERRLLSLLGVMIQDPSVSYNGAPPAP